MELKQRLISNTLFSIIELVFSRSIGFILTPYILYKIGIERFAVWSIMASMVGYLSKADMGVCTSYAKFIAQFHAKKEYKNINKVLNNGVVYYVCIGSLVYVIVFLWGDRIFDLFQIEEPIRSEVTRLFHFTVLFSVIGSTLEVFGAVLWGIQRADVIKRNRMGVMVIDALCKILFLELGYKLGGLVAAAAIVTVVGSLANTFFAFKLLPGLRFNPLLFDVKLFRQMFRYGIHLQLGRVAKMSQMHLGKLILAHFLPLSAVAIYEIGNRIVLTLQALPLSLSPSILPAASHLFSLKDTTALRCLYDRGSKYMTIIVMYISSFFGCMMPVVILSWLGPQIDIYKASTVARILLIGASYFLITDVASVVVLGMGHPEYGLRASIIRFLANILFNLTLIPKIGFVGAALATTAAELLATLYFAIASHKEFHRSYPEVVTKIYLLPIIGAGLASCCAFTLYKIVCRWFFVPQGRLQNISVLLGTLLIFSLLYGIFLVKSRYLDAYDKHQCLELYERVKNKLFKTPVYDQR
jgi:O-antigen/teichoic acid export membrane protein